MYEIVTNTFENKSCELLSSLVHKDGRQVMAKAQIAFGKVS
jgi:hypothetical protein